MGKKRNIGSVGASAGGPPRSSRWWCYYCDAEARDESALITHQLAKHFRCPFCDPRSPGGFCQGMAGLFSHVRRSHGKELTEVPGAIEGRKDIKVEVFGMTGIPDEIDTPEGESKSQTMTPPPPAVSSTGGPHTVPPRDFSQTGSTGIVAPPPAVPLGAGAAQLTAILKAAQALQGPQIAGILQQAQALQVAQALQAQQTLQALQALHPSPSLTSLLAPGLAPPQHTLSSLLGVPSVLAPGLLPHGAQVPGLLSPGAIPSPDLSALLAPVGLHVASPIATPSPDIALLASTSPASAVFASSSLQPLPSLPKASTEAPGLSSLLNTLIANQTNGTAATSPVAAPPIVAASLVTAHSTEEPPSQLLAPNGAIAQATAVASSSTATPPAPSATTDTKPQPSLVTMLTLIPQVCGNWEDSEGGLIVIKSGPNCTVIVTHETKGQQTIKYDDFIKDGRFRYCEQEGVLDGGAKITWNNGSVWTREL